MAAADDEKSSVVGTLKTAKGRELSGRMLELGDHSVTVAVTRRTARALDSGDRLTVELAGEPLSRPVKAAAHVERALEDGRKSRLTVRFDTPDDFQALLDAGIGQAFNRRLAFRVQPAAEAPIAVRVVSPAADAPVEVTIDPGQGPQLRGRAEDISVSGIGLALEGEPAKALAEGTRIVMELSLPGVSATTTVAGHVRYRKSLDPRYRIGVDFEHGTALFEAAEDVLTRWVMGRQRSLLRASRKR